MQKVYVPQKYKVFFIIISLIAIIAGSIFYFKLAPDNQDLANTYINAYFLNGEYSSIFNVLILNFLLILVIWLLGLSMFGSFFITFIYFVKVFILTVSVSSICKLESGFLKAFFYVFPNQILSIFIYALISIYAINFSFKFFQILFQKKDENFKLIFKNYNKIILFLAFFLIGVIIYQVYLNPLILKLVVK